MSPPGGHYVGRDPIFASLADPLDGTRERLWAASRMTAGRLRQRSLE